MPSPHIILLLAAALFFVFQAVDFSLGTFKPAWWALGVSAYLLALVW